MVRLNRIYTRTGDEGTTALVSGPRRDKHDLRVDAYGTVDETNSTIGLVRLHTAGMVERFRRRYGITTGDTEDADEADASEDGAAEAQPEGEALPAGEATTQADS